MTTAAVDEIWEILYDLPSPREAARALAGAHLMLIVTDGAKTEADVLVRLKESEAAVLDAWKKHRDENIADVD